MKSVLVTGGTGTLGTRLVPLLVAQGHMVRVLTHRSTAVVDGVDRVRGNLSSGAGLESAFDGIDTVVHAATRPGRGARRFEVTATRAVARAAAHVGAHLVYVSIVGVDQHRLSYYQAKWEAEQIVESMGANWSIQRATQFHELIEQFLSGPVFIKTPGLAFQPVDATEVADRLVDVVEAGPSGRLTDFGGPELLGIKTLARRRYQITGRRARLVRVPRIGPVKDFVHGVHLSPRHRDGTVTWEQWLERNYDVA